MNLTRRFQPLDRFHLIRGAIPLAAITVLLNLNFISRADDALGKNNGSSEGAASSVKTGSSAADAPGNWSLFNRTPADKLGDLVTDRPDFTESPETVEPGWSQLELTLAQYGEDFDGVDGSAVTWAYGGSLFRIGLLTDWELRLGWNGYSNRRTHDSTGANPTDTVGGGGDTNVGFKNKLSQQNGWIPNTAVIYFVSLPTGANNVSSETVDPAVKWCWSYDLTGRLAVSGNFNFSLLNPDVFAIDPATGAPTSTARNRHVQFQPTISVGYSLWDWWGVFAEYYTSHNLHPAIPDQHFFDTGFTFLVAPNLQFDVFTNIGLTKASPDRAIGIGISHRF